MLDGIAIAFVVVGLVLLGAGATLSTYAVAGVGLLLGGGAGYLVAPTLGGALGLAGPAAVVGAIAAGALLGLVVTYLLLSVTVAAISFVVGTYAGLTIVVPLFLSGSWYVEWGGALAVGLAAAAFGVVMTRTALVFVTAFLGAALVSRSLTPESFSEAQAATSVDPLVFDATAPLFLGLLAFGVALQIGLFRLSWVRRTVRRLPGGRTIRNRRGRGGTADQ